MDFPDLEALLLVHRHGSLQGAAHASGASRTTLRRRLERLEQSLGEPVYEAGNQGVSLTEAGRTLVERGPELLRARARLLEEARRQVAGAGRFRLLCQLGNPPQLTAMAVSQLSGLLPDGCIELDFDRDPARRLDEDFDAVVHWGASPLAREGYTRVLMRVPLLVQASAQYLQDHGRPESAADLADHAILHLTGTPPFWPRLEGPPLLISPRHSCTCMYALGCMAASGMGLALVPGRGLGVHPAVDALVPVLTDQFRGEGVLRLFMPAPTRRDSAAARFLEVLQDITDETLAIQPPT